MTIDCELAGVCAGCPWILEPYPAQLTRKVERLAERWRRARLPARDLDDASVITIAEQGLRDRVDLSIRGGGGRIRAGLDALDGSGVLDIERCPLMSPALADWFAEFRRCLPALGSAAVRLRVSPSGERGVWLDLSRVEAARLVAAGSWLGARRRSAVVEIGQRRSSVRALAASVVLGPPNLGPWFETPIDGGRASAALYLPIGGFSQPGFAANRRLVEAVLGLAARAGARRWLELGSGCGNLTLPLASSGVRVIAGEIDRLAREGLERSLRESGLTGAVEVLAVNFHTATPELVGFLAGREAVLADPPRSGLAGVVAALAEIPPERRPRAFLYLACSLDALVRDVRGLYDLGYRLAAPPAGVDLFPHSPHCEWLVLAQR